MREVLHVEQGLEPKDRLVHRYVPSLPAVLGFYSRDCTEELGKLHAPEKNQKIVFFKKAALFGVSAVFLAICWY